MVRKKEGGNEVDPYNICTNPNSHTNARTHLCMQRTINKQNVCARHIWAPRGAKYFWIYYMTKRSPIELAALQFNHAHTDRFSLSYGHERKRHETQFAVCTRCACVHMKLSYNIVRISIMFQPHIIELDSKKEPPHLTKDIFNVLQIISKANLNYTHTHALFGTHWTVTAWLDICSLSCFNQSEGLPENQIHPFVTDIKILIL